VNKKKSEFRSQEPEVRILLADSV